MVDWFHDAHGYKNNLNKLWYIHTVRYFLTTKKVELLTWSISKDYVFDDLTYIKTKKQISNFQQFGIVKGFCFIWGAQRRYFCDEIFTLIAMDLYTHMGFPSGASGKEPIHEYRRWKRCGFDPWVRKIPWRRAWQPTPVFLPGESNRQRSPADYSP